MSMKKEISEKGKNILNNASQEFAEKGFHDASVDNIAAKAGVGKGTVYRHFGSKEALFLEVSRGSFTEFLKSIEESIEQKSFGEMVLEILNAVTQHHYENRHAIQIIFHYISKMLNDSEWREKFIKFSDYEFEMLKKIVKTAVERKEICSDFDAEEIAEILRAFISSVPKKMVFFDYPIEKIIKSNEVLVEILVRGLKRST